MRRGLWVLIVFSCVFSRSADALDLRVAYASALASDAQFRAAIHEKTAGQLNQEIARAGLLPQIQWSYSNNKNQLERTSTDNSGRPITDNSDYTSSSNVLSLRQPLLNFESLARYRQGLAQSEQSLAVFDSQTNALAIRLMEAYSNVMLSMEQLALGEAESAAYAELMKANEALWKKGEGTRTDTIETRSRFLLSQAQLVELKGNLDTARRQLETIVGSDLKDAIATMGALTKAFQPSALASLQLQWWQDKALADSPDIKAGRSAVEAARQEVERARSGHMLRVDLVASLSRSLSETTSTINQSLNTQSAGVQLTLPLYSGGSTDAAARQASANYLKSQSQLEARMNEVMVDLSKHFNLTLAGLEKIMAFEEAVDSAQNQVVAMRKSIAGGQRVNADLLNAIQQLRQVKRDRALARHAYLIARMRLQAHTGLIGEQEISEFAQFFQQ
jgi:outer membrane protein, protease secretion system